jgi:N-acetyl-anhydromuramyl-L-alanine amidase AmpD
MESGRVPMFLPPSIIDLTGKTPAKYRIKTRASSRIDAIVLHQTAMNRGGVAENYLSVHAHFVVMPNGGIAQLHPVEAYLIASSAFNEDAIAIEFVGNFPDDRGNYWRGKEMGQHRLTPDQISSGRDLLRHLQDQHGISFIFAHRQGELASDRGNCPGPDIWYHIGEWAKRGLGMSDGGPGYTEGRGSPIPDSWRKPRA